MNRIYYLSTCSTCQRILSSLDLTNVELIDIKKNIISAQDLDFIKNKLGSYEAVFNKRAQKLKTLEEKPKNDEDFRTLILEEYTFLARPAAIIGDEVFVGNSPKTVEALQKSLVK